MEKLTKELVVTVEDRPGKFLAVADAVAKAGVNIEGFSATNCDDEGILHLVTSDPAKAKRAIQDAGFRKVQEREVFIVEVEDRTGVLASLLRPIADNEINLGPSYVLTNNRIAISANDLSGLRDVIRQAHPAGVRI